MERLILVLTMAIFLVRFATTEIEASRASTFCIHHSGEDICFLVPDGLILTGKLLTDKPMPTVTEYLKYFWCEAIYKNKTIMFCVIADVDLHKPVGGFIQYMIYPESDAWPYSIYYTWAESGSVVQLKRMKDLKEVIKEYKKGK